MKPIWGRQTVLETGSREELQKAERLLADHGLWCSSWDVHWMPVGGCGAKMRPSDWAGAAPERPDEEGVLYRLEVLKSDAQAAGELLQALRGEGGG